MGATDLSIFNSSFSNNTSTGELVTGDTLSIQYSVFNDNIVDGYLIDTSNAGPGEGLDLFNSTLTGNGTMSNRALINSSTSGYIAVHYSTIVQNYGEVLLKGTSVVSNSIIVGNSGWDGSNWILADCVDTATSSTSSFTLSGASTGCPNNSANGDLSVITAHASYVVHPLAYNGGDTKTMALQTGSPAIDASDCTDPYLADGMILMDQRFVPREGVCHSGAFQGIDEPILLMTIVAEAPGVNCGSGGTKIHWGQDIYGRGVLQEDEGTISYVCDRAGPDGDNALVALSTLAPGEGGCTTGGQLVRSGLDNGDGAGTAGDNTLHDDEVDGSESVCNGSTGLSGNDGADGSNSLIAVAALSAGQGGCVNGGQRLDSGLDNGDGGGSANDGSLQAGEVDATTLVCNGSDGADGATSLTQVTTIEAGTTCPAAGQQIQTGLDDGLPSGTAGDGTLQSGEVDTTASVCNGADGSNGSDGYSSLVSVNTLNAGQGGCASGGLEFTSGVDDGLPTGTAGNQVLEVGEVSSTTTMCNGSAGTDGQGSLVALTLLTLGDVDCPTGGQKIDVGIDDGLPSGNAGDSLLSPGEIDSTAFVCNGQSSSGYDSLIDINNEVPGSNCSEGGSRIRSGLDINRDGALADSEVQFTSYVCSGAGSAPASLVSLSDATVCTGTTIRTGLDSNGNGTLDPDEVIAEQDVCNGEDGGQSGGCSVPGQGGSSSALLLLLLISLWWLPTGPSSSPKS